MRHIHEEPTFHRVWDVRYQKSFSVNLRVLCALGGSKNLIEWTDTVAIALPRAHRPPTYDPAMPRDDTPTPETDLRARLRVWTETPRFRHTILGVIGFNAITLASRPRSA